jgi:hypothetical protein
VDEGPHHKTRYTKSHRRESEKKKKNFEWIGTGENFLNKTPMTQALRLVIGKCPDERAMFL